MAAKPKSYDGESSLNEYLQHFELCVAMNAWTPAQAGGFLGFSLAGTARRLLEGLSPCSAEGFAELKKRLRKRYEPENATGTHKAKLRAMERKDGQTLSSFADDVLELVRKSDPGVSLET